MKYDIKEGDKVKVLAGVDYSGTVTEIEDNGFWMTEDEKTEEFISFVDIQNLEVI